MRTDDMNTKPAAKSMDEIADLLAQNTMKMRGINSDDKQKPLPKKGTDQPAEDVADDDTDDEELHNDEDDEIDEIDEQEAPDGDDDSADEEDKSDDDASDDDDGSADDDASDDGIFEVDENTLFEVDDDTKVTFEELKAAYLADKEKGGYSAQQKQAVEEALTERRKAYDDGQKARRAAAAVFESFKKLVATPTVKKPDPALRSSDPARYIDQLEAYDADQKRVRDQNRDLEEAFNTHLKEEKEMLDRDRQLQLRQLSEKVPALVSQDAAVRKRAATDLLEAAQHYGFSQEEMNGDVLDHRIFQMAYDAQQYRKLMAKRANPDDTKGDKTIRVKNQTRTLRPRGTTAKNRLTAKAKEVKVARERAKKRGSVDNVAGFIAAKTGQK